MSEGDGLRAFRESIGRRELRVFFALSILLLSTPTVFAYASYATSPAASGRPAPADLSPQLDSVTVVTGHGFELTGADEAIRAYGPKKTLRYYNDTYDDYYDVDPSPVGRMTVLYVAGNRGAGACEAETRENCHLNVVELVNLSTGETTRLFSRHRASNGDNDWHDVDRIGEHRLLVGDIGRNQVFIVNTTTGTIEWAWSAQSEFPPESGGGYLHKWTHLNDVEVVRNGWVMTSLRNQDQVVFVDRQHGLVRNWTLGRDDAHEVLYEQHNPDYIPRSRGGPAVLVADSHNNRIVEYQRRNGTWKQTWVWQDRQLQWPRDADRLPAGHTLITDTHGGRVIEINESGGIVWSISVPNPYEAERLGTGDESAGGRSASALDLRSRTVDPGGGSDPSMITAFRRSLAGFVPAKVVNALIFVLPAWMGFIETLAIGVSLLFLLGWVGLELWWTPYSVRFPITRR